MTPRDEAPPPEAPRDGDAPEAPAAAVAAESEAPASAPAAAPQSAADGPPYTLFSECLQKIGAKLAKLGPAALSGALQPAVLVMSGAFNPLHVGHVRALEVAGEFVATDLGLTCVGALLSPNHDTAVRTKLRRTPGEIMPPRHRLKMCQVRRLNPHASQMISPQYRIWTRPNNLG